MLDAICTFDQDNPKTYSIFEFKLLSEAEIDTLRYFLLCPACKQKAYFRRASTDGKQACFGSRYHETDCEEFNPSARKTEEEKQVAEVEKILLEEDALVIDFNKPITQKKKDNRSARLEVVDELPETVTIQDDIVTSSISSQKSAAKIAVKQTQLVEKSDQPKACKQGLAKLLTSLLRGSSLATSDLWIYTSDTHKWRAKNLFVNIADAEPTENGAPRLYWGTISDADKSLMWLNPAENRSSAIPIANYQQALLSRFSIESAEDFAGAGFIMFAKCLYSKDKKRKYIQLWSNDLQYLHLSKVDH